MQLDSALELSMLDPDSAHSYLDIHGFYIPPRAPPGMARHDAKGRPIVLKLLKGLYGLRQAGRSWLCVFRGRENAQPFVQPDSQAAMARASEPRLAQGGGCAANSHGTLVGVRGASA